MINYLKENINNTKFLCIVNLIFGALLSLSMPNFSIGFLAWFCFAPYFTVISKEKSLKKALLYSLTFSLSYYFFVFIFFYQIHPVINFNLNVWQSLFFTVFVWVLQALTLSLYFSFFTLLNFAICRIKTNILLKSLLITTVWGIIFYFLMFPRIGNFQNALEYSQCDNMAFIQLARYIGGVGLSLILVFTNVVLGLVLSDILQEKTTIKSAVTKVSSLAFAILLVHLFGLNIYNEKVNYKNKVLVSLIQTDVTIDNIVPFPRMKQHYLQEIKRTPPGIVILPEEAYTSFDKSNKQFTDEIRQIAETQQKTIFIGSTQNIQDKKTNVMLMIKDTKTPIEVYSKTYLVPFFESDREFPIPIATTMLNFLFKIKNKKEFISTNQVRTFSIGNYKILPLICHEVFFINFFKPANLKNFDFLINMSSLIWFHGDMLKNWYIPAAKIRAIESNKPMITCINNGPSFIVSAKGEILLKIYPNCFDTKSIYLQY